MSVLITSEQHGGVKFLQALLTRLPWLAMLFGSMNVPR